MSKKTKSENNNIIYAMAFVAIICSALAWLVASILALFAVSSSAVSILNTVATVILFIWALFTSYNFTRSKAAWVKVVYWISVVIVVAGVILKII